MSHTPATRNRHRANIAHRQADAQRLARAIIRNDRGRRARTTLPSPAESAASRTQRRPPVTKKLPPRHTAKGRQARAALAKRRRGELPPAVIGGRLVRYVE